MAASFPKDAALDVTIGLAVTIFCTAIYIGCLLYKRKKIRKGEEDLENKSEIQKGLELELVESLHEETKTNTPKRSQSSSLREKENQSLSVTNSNSLKVKSKQSSLQNSSNSSKSDSRNSSIIDSTNGHKKKASKKGSTNDSSNGYSSTNSTRMSSINDNMNGYNSQRKGSIDNMNRYNSQEKGSIDMNGYNSQRKGSVSNFSSKRDPKLPSLVIKPQKNTPPPPPPSPLKSQNDSVDSLSKMMPSYVSDYTYSPPLSSKASMLSKPESRSD